MKRKFTLFLTGSLVTAFVFFYNSCAAPAGENEKQNKKTEQADQTDQAESEKTFTDYEIPASLQDNPEVKAYFKELSRTMDEFAGKLEKHADVIMEYKDKNTEDLSAMEQIKMATVMGKIAVEMTPFLTKLSELSVRATEMQNNLTNQELEEFNRIFDKFDKRMQELEKKYEDLNTGSGQ